jgi:hypothetical protein
MATVKMLTAIVIRYNMAALNVTQWLGCVPEAKGKIVSLERKKYTRKS